MYFINNRTFAILIVFLININLIYADNRNNYFFLLENSISSNKINNFILSNGEVIENNFISTEKKAYIEYIFNKNYNFGLQLKQKTIENLDYILLDNYFYNLFIKYNYYYDSNNEYYFLFGYGNAIHYNKELKLSSNNDIYNNIFLEFSYKIIFDSVINPYNNNYLKFNIKYTYLDTTIKDNLTFNLNYGKKINLSSLMMFEYIFNYDINKNLKSYITNNYPMYSHKFSEFKNILLSKGHSFNVYFIVNFTNKLSFFVKNGIEIFNKKNIYNLSFGFWLQ